MKKWIVWTLVVVMLCLQVCPVFADTADERLAAVAAKVKATLELDTERYTEFYGDVNEAALAPSWHLEWTAEDGSLSVSATEDGKILNYHRYQTEDHREPVGFVAAFPAGNQADARAAAEQFIHRVLTQGESVTMEETKPYLGATQYRFHGEILLHGLSAGLSYSISVEGEDNAVVSFYRDDLNGRVINEIPSPKAAIVQEDAGSSLRETLQLRLEYVLPEDGTKTAVLRYLPEYGDAYYVDAQTGELVNLTQLSQELKKGASGGGSNNLTMDAATESMAGGSLSRVEQEGVDKLKGVLDKETLEKVVREITALGLNAYTLSTVNYSVARDADADGTYPVTAVLRFGRQVQEKSWHRTVTVDARNGALIRVFSSAYMQDGIERKVNQKQAQALAEQFLQKLDAATFAKTEVYDSTDAMESAYSPAHSFTYAQKENGYFFPQNQIYLAIDAADGSVSGYEKQFDDQVTFADAEEIVTEDAALDAWLNTYQVKLQYVQVPYALDYSMPEYKPLMEYGIAYLHKLVLGYALEREEHLLGIDAKSGKPVMPAREVEEIAYTDIKGHWAEEQISKLAEYGVGYPAEKFLPEEPLNQLDLLVLLSSAEGYRYTQDADQLYQWAYRTGLLTKTERNETMAVTRSQAVRMLVRGAGYRTVAQLKDIFRTKFVDESEIPAEDYGYVALAQGFGIVQGDKENRFYPNMPTTRAEAAVMIYNYMNR